MSIGGQQPGTAGKVPVWQTAIDSYRFVFSNLGRFFVLGWLPILIAVAVGMTSVYGIELVSQQDDPVGHMMAHQALSSPVYAMYVVFAVRWHRFFLLDDREGFFSEILAARNWRFLGYTLLLSFVPIAPMLIMDIIGFGPTYLSKLDSQSAETAESLVALLAVLPAFAVPVLVLVVWRFFLLLPSAAVDRMLGPGEAWRKMRGNTWRFIFIACLFLIPTIIASWNLSELSGQPMFGYKAGSGSPVSAGVFMATYGVSVIFSFFVTAVGITVLSIFYRHIVGMDAPESGEGGAVGP